MKWWKVYDDEVLNQLINFALIENKDLKTARLNINKSEEGIELAKSSQGLEVNAIGNIKREKLSKNGTIPPPFDGKIFTIGALGLQGSYNIDIFNKLHSLTEEQKYKSESIKLNNKWIELNITNRVAKLYFYWNYLQQEKKILNNQKDNLKKIIRFNEKNFNIGNGIKTTIWESENELRKIESFLKENQLNIQITINNLNILTGNKYEKKIDDLLNRKQTKVETLLSLRLKIPSIISSDIIINRPDVKYYLMLIRGQEKYLIAAKADFYPQFSITGEYGFEGITLGKVLKKDSLLGFIGPSLYLPIFHSNAIKSNYKIAGIDLNIFINEYNNAIITAYNSINNELYKTKILTENLKSLKSNLITQTKILDQDKERLVIGTISQLEYTTKEYQWNSYNLNYEQENFKLSIQQLTLINVLGGSYSINN